MFPPSPIQQHLAISRSLGFTWGHSRKGEASSSESGLHCSLLFCFHLKRSVVFFPNFWPQHAAWDILVSQPGIKPVPSAVEAKCLNYWTAREVLEKEGQFLLST